MSTALKITRQTSNNSTTFYSNGILLAFGNGLVRFNDAGELDTSFGDEGRLVLNETRSEIFITDLPDGNIVFANYKRIFRCSSKGKLDSTFGEGGAFTVPDRESIVAMVADSDGLINYITINLDPVPTHSLGKVSSNGEFDLDFNKGEQVKLPKYKGESYGHWGYLAPDDKNKCWTAMNIENRSSVVLRYQRSGVIDETFGTLGISEPPISRTQSIQASGPGKLVIAGHHRGDKMYAEAHGIE